LAIQKNAVPRIPLPPKLGQAQAYVTADEAARSLGIKVATLYAYVSRGIVRSIAEPGRRRRLYYREDVERAARRMGGRAGMPETVEAVLSWGQPVIQTALTDLTAMGPVYRGRSAIGLAEAGRSFESVAELLWTGMDLPQLAAWQVGPAPEQLAQRLAASARSPEALSGPRLIALTTSVITVWTPRAPDFERGTTVSDARELIVLYAGALGLMGKPGRFLAPPSAGWPVAELLLRALTGTTSREAVRALNYALVLCADHELSSATLSARVAASCAADLRACILAAVATHSGKFFAGGCDDAEALLRTARGADEMHAVMAGIERSGARIPGYNMKAYPKGDPRARKLLELAARLGGKSERILEVVSGVETRFDLQPSLEVGLVALCVALDLPVGGAAAIWTLGRVAGWVAHVIEQRQAAFLMRPRARYVGPPPTY